MTTTLATRESFAARLKDDKLVNVFVDSEFASLIAPLSFDERNMLEANINKTVV